MGNFSKSTVTARFPYKAYTLPVLLLSVSGLLASGYLTISHYRNYTDIAYSSFCAISKAINCDTVSQSSWSILLGLPAALWGMIGYAQFFVVALPAQKNTEERRYLWDILFLIAALYTLTDVYFAYIAVVRIKAYCIVCLFTYAVSLGLLFSTWIIRRRFNSHPLWRGLKKGFSVAVRHRGLCCSVLVLSIITLLARIYIPRYWIVTYPTLSSDIHQGITEAGHPWVGAEEPKLTIHEFTDYQCFQCSKMHLILRTLVNEHPDTIRLVHRQYPMDEKFNTVLVKEPFHSGSGDLALLAIAAGRQGKFWQANDALYSVTRQGIKEFNIKKFAQKLDLDAAQLLQDMYSMSALKVVEADIRAGLKLRITGTPTYVIDGKIYPGFIPADILNAHLQQETR